MSAAIIDEELVRRFPATWTPGLWTPSAGIKTPAADQPLAGRHRLARAPGPDLPALLVEPGGAHTQQATGFIVMAIFLLQGPPVEGVDSFVPVPGVAVELDKQMGLRFAATVTGAVQADTPSARGSTWSG
jgi:hypothetical protein